MHVEPDHRIVLKRSRGRRIVERDSHWLALVRKYGAKGYASEKHRDSDQPYYAVVSRRNKSLSLFVQKFPVVFVHFFILSTQGVPDETHGQWPAFRTARP